VLSELLRVKIKGLNPIRFKIEFQLEFNFVPCVLSIFI